MSFNVAPFHLTPEDLAGLDRKTMAALQPLIEALNVTLGQTVAALAAVSDAAPVPLTLRTGSIVADSFPLQFRTPVAKPVWIGMVCNPRNINESHASARVMQGFGLTDAGLVSIPFITGLVANSTYDFVFLVR